MTVTNLDDPCLVVGISCSMSQGLAGAHSYIPVSTPLGGVLHSEGLEVSINGLSKLPPVPKLGAGESGIQTNKQPE